jgi:S-sulfo-L-cysteine synthase (O-acetyl-L-serine-dependent)
MSLLSGRRVEPGMIDRIGDTPLLPIGGLDVPEGAVVLGKAEWLNPGGSVKDRAAWAIVRAALIDGSLGGGRRLLDATSGNTGIAYAWIGAALGFGVTLCVPGNAGAARLRALAALGAAVVSTDPMDGTDGAIREAQRMAAEHPERWFHADQYGNAANWRAHYHGTALEIWAQSRHRITHFVAGIGTAGTLVGTARRLRELSPTIEVVAFQPDSPYHALEGLKHLPSALRPAIYDPSAHQRTIEVGSEEAITMARRQAGLGLPIGWSAGAALVAAARVAGALERGVVVAVLPDGAERYLDDPAWEGSA